MLSPFSNSSRLCPTFLPTQHYILFLSLKTTSKTNKKPTHAKIPQKNTEMEIKISKRLKMH